MPESLEMKAKMFLLLRSTSLNEIIRTGIKSVSCENKRQVVNVGFDSLHYQEFHTTLELYTNARTVASSPHLVEGLGEHDLDAVGRHDERNRHELALDGCLT